MPRLIPVPVPVCVIAWALAAGVGCSSASGTISGGEPYDGGASDTASTSDAAATIEFCLAQSDAGPPGDAGVAGATWTELHRDIFGGSAKSACAGNGSCHGAANAPGAVTSGFVCPRDDKDACHRGITDSTIGLIDVGAPENSRLYAVLRKSEGGAFPGKPSNIMPQQPSCAFSPSDMARIVAWMKAGAPND